MKSPNTKPGKYSAALDNCLPFTRNLLILNICRLKTFLLILSLFFLFSFLGCTSPKPIIKNGRDLIEAQNLVNLYGQLNSEFSNEYFQKIILTLDPSLKNYTFHILNTEDLIATGTTNKSILISKGLILRLKNEAQLVFVIAHECAHDLMKHRTEATSVDSSIRANNEYEADRLGIALTIRAGYDPYSAINSLYYAHAGTKNFSYYPNVDERVLKVSAFIAQTGWMPPGLTDRRDFRELREYLKNYTAP